MRVYSPEKIEEATEILGRLKGRARILAGGTDLVVRMKERAVHPQSIVDISRLPLDYIKEGQKELRIGALTTLEEIFRSGVINAYAPLLSDAAGKMGSPQIRNLGTIGGNIANASPAADTVPPLFVHRAALILRSQRGRRAIGISEFFRGPGKSVMERDEMITEVVLRKMGEDECWFFRKLGGRKAMAISKVSLAFMGMLHRRRLARVSIALGAVAPTVVYARRTARFLATEPLSPELIDEASRIIQDEAQPISDIRSTSEYRRRMVGALLKQGLLGL